MGWRQHEMIRRVAAPAVAILLGASCGAGASTAAGHRSTAAANRASAGSAAQVLGRQLARRSGIVVTPYEQQAFLELTFTTATATAARRPILERWTGNPTIHISGDPTVEDLAQVAESARRWSAITGHTMTVVAGPGNVDLRFVHRSDFGHVIDTGDVDPSAVGLTRVTLDPEHRGAIKGALVVIADDDIQVGRNRTIDHELGHVIGLQHSTCASSLMDGSSDGARSVRWTPTALDVRIGALLYDPHLQPGLGLDAVRAILRPTATDGATCGPVDLELIRAAGSGRHYLCVHSDAAVRPCTSDLSREPTLPLVGPDAWTDGNSLSSRPHG